MLQAGHCTGNLLVILCSFLAGSTAVPAELRGCYCRIALPHS